MKLLLALALLFSALPGNADDVADPATEGPGAAVAAKKAHPDLLRLEQELTRKLDEKQDGRITPEQYQAWKSKFRARLDAAMTRIPSSPDNIAAHARITAQLGVDWIFRSISTWENGRGACGGGPISKCPNQRDDGCRVTCRGCPCREKSRRGLSSYSCDGISPYESACRGD